MISCRVYSHTRPESRGMQAYRQRLVDEDNARKQLDIARANARQAELQVREANDPSLAGGAGKKKKKK